jgi:hypothetical protein
MKSVLLINFILIYFYNYFNVCDCEKKYSIKIWDYNYTMAYTTFYTISDDSVTVKYISGIKNEADSILMKKSLSESECKVICNFLSSHNIYHLKNKYSTPLVDDGDQKRLIIEVDGKTKTIEIANFYQKDIGELFETINKILSNNLRIKYKAPTR